MENPNKQIRENDKTFFEQYLYPELTPIEEQLTIVDKSEVGLSYE